MLHTDISEKVDLQLTRKVTYITVQRRIGLFSGQQK